MLNLLILGDVRAAGKTIPRLREDLTQRYKGKLTNPELMLSLESASPAVYVSGAVNKGGKVELTRNLTILEVIMEAGGFTRGLADPKHVQVIRKINGKEQMRRSSWWSVRPNRDGPERGESRCAGLRHHRRPRALAVTNGDCGAEWNETACAIAQPDGARRRARATTNAE